MVDIQAGDPGQVDSVTKASCLVAGGPSLPLFSFSPPLCTAEDSTPLKTLKFQKCWVTQHQLRLALDHSPLKSFSGTIVLLVTKILCYFPDFKDIISVTS